MRTLSVAIGMLSLLLISVAAQTTEKAVLRVSGMSCGACAKTVEKEAKKIEGVKVAKVSQAKGEAEITYDPAKTSPEAIAKRINDKTAFKAEAPKAADKK